MKQFKLIASNVHVIHFEYYPENVVENKMKEPEVDVQGRIGSKDKDGPKTILQLRWRINLHSNKGQVAAFLAENYFESEEFSQFEVINMQELLLTAARSVELEFKKRATDMPLFFAEGFNKNHFASQQMLDMMKKQL